MRVVIQRVAEAAVSVDGRRTAGIGPGLMVLVGVTHGDGDAEAQYLAGKIAGLRIFGDQEGRLNRSVVDCGGAVLVVPQFTLYGGCRKGRRPSFMRAADPAEADRLYTLLADELRGAGLEVQTGEFGASMQVSLVNDGPVTLLLDSEGTF